MRSDTEAFIERWKTSGGSERANFQRFAIELTQLLGVEEPALATSDDQNDHYRFERPVDFGPTSTRSHGFIDLYRRGCFVLEAKQGAERKTKQDPNQLSLLTDAVPKQARVGHGVRGTRRWDDTMLKARNQADRYARAIAREDGWPPFLLIVDVGHVIEVYADFSGQGQGYSQYPDGNTYRIKLDGLADEQVRQRLKTIWEDPLSLNPSLQSEKVTREIADHLAKLGVSLEGEGHDSETVARFLMRCLFSMFAEDVELIPKGSFTELLVKLRGHPEHAAPSLQGLWETMNKGGFSQVLMQDLKRFNGGLFADATALPVNNVQLSLLIEAAEADWKQVEPAIFGTLLERALDKRQRHKLGAHYTPRSYVERLVTPTIMEPLREDWKDVQTAVQRLTQDGKDEDAKKLVQDFHRKLCEVRVLDPACGSGNFLYVALELMKRLEGEVTALLEELGESQTSLGLSGMTVDPHQFLGIEVNPWAAAVSELVLWIGFLQWHFRTYGKAAPSEPVLKDFKNIECRDAVLEWSDRKPRVDSEGRTITRWDGLTTKRSPVTGEEVPDTSSQIEVFDYTAPKPAQWPRATFIVGNPPFIGTKRMRDELGSGYVEALWQAYPSMPRNTDFVMFWWHKAASEARAWSKSNGSGCRRFGLITTNSIGQTHNRVVVERQLAEVRSPLSLLLAIPDHPWVDTQYGAAVRIAMTVGAEGERKGALLTIASEKAEAAKEGERSVTFEVDVGKLSSRLRLGADLASAKPLRANAGVAWQGCKLVGSGFQVTPGVRKKLLDASTEALTRLPEYIAGGDITKTARERYVVDLFGLSDNEAAKQFPALYQHLLDHVKPYRDANTDAAFREKWWLFGRPRPDMRRALHTLKRYIATSEVSKHRTFVFLDWPDQLVDGSAIAVCTSDATILAVLSGSWHRTWSLAQGGTLEDRPRYHYSHCFDPFPFPDLNARQAGRLSQLGDQLDAHRKRQQAAHPKLTLTQMYNVLEKLRAGETIEGKDKDVYEYGLIGILKELHDQIDAAVADAYGWPVDLSDEDILMRLVELNRQRAEEEARGLVRWLRPEYQNPEGKTADAQGEQGKMDVGVAEAAQKVPWPKTLPEQIAAVREALEATGEATPEQIARQFKRARTSSVQPLLESLAALGQATALEGGKYAA